MVAADTAETPHLPRDLPRVSVTGNWNEVPCRGPAGNCCALVATLADPP